MPRNHVAGSYCTGRPMGNATKYSRQVLIFSSFSKIVSFARSRPMTYHDCFKKKTRLKKSYLRQIGAPCPETMELGPAAGSGGTIAECRCPPGTAQSPRDAVCHPIFTRASCSKGQFFAPVSDASDKSG